MIVTAYNLYQYTIALKNSGVTQENINMLERQFLPLLFGVDGATRLIKYINENKTLIEATKTTNKGSYDFGGNPQETVPKYTYGDITELIEGDNILFSGLKALLSIMIALTLISQNREQVARQNVTKQPVNSRAIAKREETEVVQSLAFQGKSIIYAMKAYLKQDGKNPLKLEVTRTIEPTRYSTNTSGKMGMNMGMYGIYGWF